MAKNIFVEQFKDSFVLDALRLRDINTLTINELLGLRADISDFEAQLLFGKYRLVLIWDKSKPSLSDDFTRKEELQAFINEKLNEAYIKAILKYDEYIYTLNLATVESYGNFPIYGQNKAVEQQLKLFMPIMCKFMIDALADNLPHFQDS